MITNNVKWNRIMSRPFSRWKCWARANDKFYLSVLLAQYSRAKMVKPLATTPTVTINAVRSAAYLLTTFKNNETPACCYLYIGGVGIERELRTLSSWNPTVKLTDRAWQVPWMHCELFLGTVKFYVKTTIFPLRQIWNFLTKKYDKFTIFFLNGSQHWKDYIYHIAKSFQTEGDHLIPFCRRKV